MKKQIYSLALILLTFIFSILIDTPSKLLYLLAIRLIFYLLDLGFSGGFYQAFAAIFGASLKKEYHPEDEDALIERIVLQVESGQL